MTSQTYIGATSKKMLWAGRIISGLPALFLLIDGAMKLVKPAPVVEATVATHVRVEEGWFPILFPVAIGALLWGGLCLREERLRSLLPVRRARPSSLTKQPQRTEAVRQESSQTAMV